MPSPTIPNIVKILAVVTIMVLIPLTVFVAQQNQQVTINATNTTEVKTAHTKAQISQAIAPQSCDKAKLVFEPATGNPITIPNPVCLSGIGGVNNFFVWVIDLLLITVSIISFFMLLWGGMAYMLSQGEKEGIGKAKARITYAIVGLVVSILSFTLINLLQNILGFKLLL